MGCRNSRSIIETGSPDNNIVFRYEKSLKLDTVPTSSFECLLRRYSKPGVSLESVLENVQRDLKLTIKPSVVKVLVSKNLETESLLTFFILNSKGDEAEKAEALWYVFENQSNDEMSAKDFKELLKKVIDMSYAVTITANIEDEESNSNRLKALNTRIKQRVETFHKNLTSHFIGESNSIRKEEFLLKVKDRPEGFITLPMAVRCQIEKIKVMPTNFSNPFKK